MKEAVDPCIEYIKVCTSAHKGSTFQEFREVDDDLDTSEKVGQLWTGIHMALYILAYTKKIDQQSLMTLTHTRNSSTGVGTALSKLTANTAGSGTGTEDLTSVASGASSGGSIDELFVVLPLCLRNLVSALALELEEMKARNPKETEEIAQDMVAALNVMLEDPK